MQAEAAVIVDEALAAARKASGGHSVDARAKVGEQGPARAEVVLHAWGAHHSVKIAEAGVVILWRPVIQLTGSGDAAAAGT